MDKNLWTDGATSAFPPAQTSTSTMTQTANCARHLGVIVGKMLPHPLPQIYTPVAKEAILLRPLTSCQIPTILFKEAILRIWTEKRFIQNQVNLNNFFFVFIFTESFEMTRANDMLSANWTCHISVMVSVAFLHVTMSLFFKPINGAQHEIKRRWFV